MKRVIVAGGGLGGLSAAIRLAADGFKVTLLEKNDRVGGKADFLRLGPYFFDTGPTLLTMPFVLEDLFSAAKLELRERLELIKIEPACRYFFPEGGVLDAWSDAERMEREISRFAPGDAGAFSAFMKKARNIYEAAAPPFLYSAFSSASASETLRLLKYLPSVVRLDSSRTLNESVEGHFKDVRLRKVFNRFATYNGSSPYLAPATLAIIAYVEFAFGGWYVKGGLRRMVDELLKAASGLGVEIVTGAEVARILCDGAGRSCSLPAAADPRPPVSSRRRVGVPRARRRVRGVRLADGTVLESDIVISNIDASLTRRELLGGCGHGSARSGLTDPSMAGFALYLGVRGKYESLTQHNIFFSRDYREEFRQIFEERRPAEDPTIYVCASCLRDPEHAPPGGMNLFILVNVPAADGSCDWSARKTEYCDLIIGALESRGMEGLNSATEIEEIITPEDFERRYNAPGGAIYGSSSNSRWAAFRRPPNRSREARGLYYAGGSAHPGGGIPLVLLSGAHAAELVRKDHA